MTTTPFAKKNKAGFWVGCLKYDNGIMSEVTNAKLSEANALEIADRMAKVYDEYLKSHPSRKR